MRQIFLWLFVVFDTIVCVFFLCALFPRTADNLNFDYMSIIVAVFSLLVTVLIAWQIYNSISFREEVRKLETIKENFTNSHFKILAEVGLSSYRFWLRDVKIDSFLSASASLLLGSLTFSNGSPIQETLHSKVIESLLDINKHLQKNETCAIYASEEDLRQFQINAAKTGNKNVIELVNRYKIMR